MNRREFTKGLVAAGMTPALPIKSLAKAAPVAKIAKDSMYFWAHFVTRVHNKCSPAMLTRLLKLEPAQSEKIYADLLADGAITPADAFGISRATDPLYQQFATVTGHGPKISSASDKPLKKLEKIVEAETDDTREETPDNDDNSREIEEVSEGFTET